MRSPSTSATAPGRPPMAGAVRGGELCEVVLDGKPPLSRRAFPTVRSVGRLLAGLRTGSKCRRLLRVERHGARNHRIRRLELCDLCDHESLAAPELDQFGIGRFGPREWHEGAALRRRVVQMPGNADPGPISRHGLKIGRKMQP